MAHLFLSFLFVYKAREVFISNLPLIKLKISEMGFTATGKCAHKLCSLRGHAARSFRALESQTACENGDCVSTKIEGLRFIVARWGSWMQLLLTTGSLREQQATAIKTGIQGKAIYRATTQTCMQELMSLTVMHRSVSQMWTLHSSAHMAQIFHYFITFFALEIYQFLLSILQLAYHKK